MNYISYIVPNHYTDGRDVTSEMLRLYNDFHLNKIDNKPIDSFFKRNLNNIVCLYHGTGFSNHDDIYERGKGLLRTNKKTAKSYMSEHGYVYLSIHYDHAELFGKVGYPYDKNIVIYKVGIPIYHLAPDKDQIYSKNYWGIKELKPSMTNSLLYGNGFRVKGDIPKYMIESFFIEDK